ncbi:hypothetical protein GCM10028805_52260 [Spirosoma harenae]
MAPKNGKEVLANPTSAGKTESDRVTIRKDWWMWDSLVGGWVGKTLSGGFDSRSHSHRFGFLYETFG